MYECKAFSFKKDSNSTLRTWKSTAIDNYSVNSDLKAISDASNLFPSLENNGRMNVNFSSNYFRQDKILHPNSNNLTNIYIVDKLDPTSFSRITDYTTQNALFGNIGIIENASDNRKNKHAGYGIFFDEGSNFSIRNIVKGKNVIIFGADMSFSSHSTNKANDIYVLDKDFIQGTNGTTIYGKFYDFAVDYQVIDGVKTIYDIHRYLMTKRNI